MAVTQSMDRMAVVINWDTEVVQGDEATISAQNPDTGEDFAEKKTVKNDGEGWLSFPAGYVGMCNVRVEGSDGGMDEGQLTIGQDADQSGMENE